ncbi:2Fe-2S iron-sulfur cluster-binding protein [Haloquadratum walsbyi]|uniref:Na+-transporting NADH:ubiquinone oxidoreductase, subunit NqrF n=1 Tax=Haloquadratum walsbyi J07HQW2 TaxID=1238425 RepID=U1NC16_9EURY|nr:2Fe-2S iron-sulfur cluster binding domain-containing protein [Haloquadratum walsbyi]ERG94223.1 MAG: Na+-transporting NADH:ubiquinone oxidoreductase, subunit NqrF [Haloquadratum walsbyi J07HQW2]
MPEVTYRGISLECESGATLRTVLFNNAVSPHSGVTKAVNCGGNSTCGTCAVRIVDGPIGERTVKEQTRLAVSTHDDADNIRLACQYRVTDDVVIEKA